MKKLLCVLLSMVIILTTSCSGENEDNIISSTPDSNEALIQDLDYSESLETILNPNQGFYKPLSVKLTHTEIEYRKKTIKDGQNLYHLRIDISDFSANASGTSEPFTSEALEGLDDLLSYLYENEKSAILRLAYDEGFDGNANYEPNLDIILTHIKQVSAIFNKYEQVLTGIEVGLVGPWGEMHTSTMANSEVINALIDTYLKNTNNIPILVRTPKMIYNYLGITIDEIESFTITSNSLAYRLGIFNDGYLGSKSDLGTYQDREKEINWLSNQTSHLPFGGEVVKGDSDRVNIKNCLDEMNLINLSYLNVEWNDSVINSWKEDTYTKDCDVYSGKSAFAYIENHMGYRFVLRESQLIKHSNSYDVNLMIDNVGFGNLNKKTNIRVILKDNSGNIKVLDNVLEYNGEANYTFNINTINLTGEYKIYIEVLNDIENNRYHIEFANSALYDKELKALLIGNINI